MSTMPRCDDAEEGLERGWKGVFQMLDMKLIAQRSADHIQQTAFGVSDASYNFKRAVLATRE